MEKIQKITLALGHQKLEQTIMNTIKDGYIYTDVVTRKGLLYITVKEDMPDAIIVNNELPGEDNETLYDTLYKIRADFPKVRIILLLKVEEGEYSVLEPYIQIGIYDIWTKSNIRLDALIDFIDHPLNFGDWAGKIDRNSMKSANLNISSNASVGHTSRENKETSHDAEETASGFLKIKKQENKKVNDSKKIVVPSIVKNTGFVSGRPKKNQAKQEQILKENTHRILPEIERKQVEFSIDDSLKKEQIVAADIIEIETARENSPRQTDVINVKTQDKRNNVKSNENPESNLESKAVNVRNSDSQTNKPTTNSLDKGKEQVANPQIKQKISHTPTGGLLKENKQSNANKPLINRTVKILSAAEREALKKTNNINQTASKPITKPITVKEKAYPPTQEKEIKNKVPIDKKNKESIRERTPISNVGTDNKSAIVKSVPENTVGQKKRLCKTILFAQSERHSMSHTALNLAIILAKKGFQVAYISTFSASDDLLIKYTPIQIYDKYDVKQGALVEKIPTLAILKYDISKSFELLEKIKEENEVDFLIFNTDIKDEFEKIMILAEKSYILLEQNPVIFAKLNKSYKHLFRYMNVVVESFRSTRDSCEDISNYTKCKKIIKLTNTDTMNYDAIMKHRPLVLDNEKVADEFVQLLSETE